MKLLEELGLKPNLAESNLTAGSRQILEKLTGMDRAGGISIAAERCADDGNPPLPARVFDLSFGENSARVEPGAGSKLICESVEMCGNSG
jgi:hypothetical protein